MTHASDESGRARLYGLLGDLPDRHRAIGARQRDERERDGYILETWDLDLNGTERVSAYVARPRGPGGRRPAVLYNHSHGDAYATGKTELVDGCRYLHTPPYAKALTDLGCVVLAIDHWVFGERAHSTELDTFKRMLWNGQVLWGAMVYDSLRALDWLAARPDVDAGRLGTLGMSMGSSMAQWVAALDERIAATVDICCLVEFEALLADGGLSRHGIYYFVPGLLQHFTASQINALIAPRPHLSLVGTRDDLAPVQGVNAIDAALSSVYGAAGRPDHWRLVRYDVGHQETAEGRIEATAFLRRYLRLS